MKVSASILANKLTSLQQTLPDIKSSYIDYIHLDIMDGNFVPQISFGEQISQEISEITNIPLDIHLMVQQPEKEVEKYFNLKPNYLTFHFEATRLPIPLAKRIKKHGIHPGIALNPSTPIENLIDILCYFDLCLIMTVEPGFCGQSFIKSSIKKIKKFVEIKKQYRLKTLLAIDGGINQKTMIDIKGCPIDIIIAGSFIFKAKDPNQQAELLKKPFGP